MIANYHTHTTRCHHAKGADEEYVLAAIERGLKTLGFADHTPQFYPNGYISSAKMLPADTDDYVESVLRLREKYKGQIDIRLGFETEYYPDIWDELLAFYRRYPIDYLILGQHYVGTESLPGEFCSFQETKDTERLQRFFTQELSALNTGRFTYLAHPDVLRFSGDADAYKAACRPLIKRAREMHVPLEINLLGLRFGRHYPNPLFWEVVGEVGAEAILGCDAHDPQHIAVAEEIEKAHTLAKSFGVRVLDDVSLVNPIF